MSLSDICIRRPVFTWVLVGIPVVLGIVSYFDMGVDLFPKVDFPVISVSAALRIAKATPFVSKTLESLKIPLKNHEA